MSNLVNLFERSVEKSLSKINTSFPAEIIEIVDSMYVNVKPLVLIHGVEIESIIDVRLIQNRSNSHGLSIAPTVGDKVLIIVCQSSLDKFLKNGDVIPRQFNIGDAVALNGFLNSESSLDTGITIDSDGIQIKKGDVNLKTELDDLKGTVNDIVSYVKTLNGHLEDITTTSIETLLSTFTTFKGKRVATTDPSDNESNFGGVLK